MTEYAAGESRLLRAALLLDSILEGALGLPCILAAEAVAGLLGLQQPNATLWLRLFGFLLVAYGALLLWVSAQQHISRRVTAATILLNIGWVFAVALLLATDVFGFSSTGITVVIAITAATALLTVIEYVGLRRLLS